MPSAVNGLSFSFSGPETALLRAIREKAASPAAIARAAEHCIAKTLEKVLRQAIARGYPKDVLLVGGVAANGYIRAHLKKRLEHPAVGAALAFASRLTPATTRTAWPCWGGWRIKTNISLKNK